MALDALENLEAEREQTEQKLNETLRAKLNENIVSVQAKTVKSEIKVRKVKTLEVEQTDEGVQSNVVGESGKFEQDLTNEELVDGEDTMVIILISLFYTSNIRLIIFSL